MTKQITTCTQSRDLFKGSTSKTELLADSKCFKRVLLGKNTQNQICQGVLLQMLNFPERVTQDQIRKLDVISRTD